MKKPVALFSCALLVGTFMLGATSCFGPSASKLFPAYDYEESTQTLSVLTKDDNLDSIDDFGLAVLTSETRDGSSLVSTTYKLVNILENEAVNGASITVPATPPTGDLSYSVSSGIARLTDGMYAERKVNYTRATTSDPFKEEITYTLYGQEGSVAANLKGSYNGGDHVFYCEDGTRYYVNVDGELVSEENPFVKFLPYGMGQKIGKNYMVSTGSYVFDIYDKDGDYKRTADALYEVGIPMDITISNAQFWQMDKYLFVQYSLALPATEKDFDYQVGTGSGSVKYDLVTVRYDIASGKVKDIDMDYVIKDVEEDAEFYDYCIADVYAIKDQRLVGKEVVQSFDKDGDVAVDFQDLVPGAESVRPIGGVAGALLFKGDDVYVVQKRKVVAQYDKNLVQIAGESVIVENEDKVTIYNLKGKKQQEYSNVVSTTQASRGYLIQTETELIMYDLVEGEESKICSITKDKTKVTNEGLYLLVQSYGADGVENTADDTYSYYFQIPELQNVTLTAEQNSQYSVVEMAYYSKESDSEDVRGGVICVKSGEVYSYYFYKMVVEF